jgi:hypothetical protein
MRQKHQEEEYHRQCKYNDEMRPYWDRLAREQADKKAARIAEQLRLEKEEELREISKTISTEDGMVNLLYKLIKENKDLKTELEEMKKEMKMEMKEMKMMLFPPGSDSDSV